MTATTEKARKLINPPGTEEFYNTWQFSQGARVGNMIWLAGHLGIGPDGKPGATIEEQTRLAFQNVVRTLEAAGSSLDDIVDLTTYHIAMSELPTVAAAIAEFADWRAHLQRNPDQRAQLLALDPQRFADTMRHWENFVTDTRFPFAGLSNAELRQIQCPTFITPGLDALHPLPICQRLAARLPHATLLLPEERFSAAEMAQIQQWYEADHGHIRYLPALAPLLHAFMME